MEYFCLVNHPGQTILFDCLTSIHQSRYPFPSQVHSRCIIFCLPNAFQLHHLSYFDTQTVIIKKVKGSRCTWTPMPADSQRHQPFWLEAISWFNVYQLQNTLRVTCLDYFNLANPWLPLHTKKRAAGTWKHHMKVALEVVHDPDLENYRCTSIITGNKYWNCFLNSTMDIPYTLQTGRTTAVPPQCFITTFTRVIRNRQ